ncbi:putative mitochondrial protein [Sesamum angolense]|uniref:Mitochondrial protein n=1 Tax=Sesamum angolense TaxID=2727404 RepID=A0AAE1WAE8_9LAMI|nr:putative mitochondrial protein [Sesamum angolense]
MTHWVGWKKMCPIRKEGALGFREMKAFNQALLAKQGWRLLKQHDSLLSRTLQAKYFHGSSFLVARVGLRPLLTWRSMIEARELLISGYRWQIGSGVGVRLWRDRWLPRPMNFRITSAPRVLHSEARVAKLIDRNTGCWQTDLVRQVIDVDDANLVLEMPLNRMGRPDVFIWHYTRKGEFSIRSAYQLELQTEQQLRPSSSRERENLDWVHGQWDFIWQSHTPPKVRTSVWCVCHEALPTTTNLAKRNSMVLALANFPTQQLTCLEGSVWDGWRMYIGEWGGRQEIDFLSYVGGCLMYISEWGGRQEIDFLSYVGGCGNTDANWLWRARDSLR